MKETIKKLQAQLDQIDQRKKDLQRAIDSLQKLCDHKFEPAGHTHKTHEKCTECGMEITFLNN